MEVEVGNLIGLRCAVGHRIRCHQARKQQQILPCTPSMTSITRPRPGFLFLCLSMLHPSDAIRVKTHQNWSVKLYRDLYLPSTSQLINISYPSRISLLALVSLRIFLEQYSQHLNRRIETQRLRPLPSVQSRYALARAVFRAQVEMSEDLLVEVDVLLVDCVELA